MSLISAVEQPQKNDFIKPLSTSAKEDYKQGARKHRGIAPLADSVGDRTHDLTHGLLCTSILRLTLKIQNKEL